MDWSKLVAPVGGEVGCGTGSVGGVQPGSCARADFGCSALALLPSCSPGFVLGVSVGVALGVSVGGGVGVAVSVVVGVAVSVGVGVGVAVSVGVGVGLQPGACAAGT